MDAEFSVELGADDPTLAVPWQSPDGAVHYVSLRDNPEEVDKLTEVREFPEIGEFLRSLNSRSSKYGTAKCDVWFDTLMDVDDEPYQATVKCVSYVDLFFAGESKLADFAAHERAARAVVQRLRVAPGLRARAEFVVRHAYFSNDQGFYWTVYVFGYGEDAIRARAAWAEALSAVQQALL